MTIRDGENHFIIDENPSLRNISLIRTESKFIGGYQKGTLSTRNMIHVPSGSVAMGSDYGDKMMFNDGSKADRSSNFDSAVEDRKKRAKIGVKNRIIKP